MSEELKALKVKKVQVNVRLRDFEAFTLTKIAEVMGVSKARAATALLQTAIHRAQIELEGNYSWRDAESIMRFKGITPEEFIRKIRE